MDSFYIGYRDPLFGIIVFFSLIFIVSFVNYWWSVYKEKDEEKSIQKFIKKFQIQSEDNEYKIIFEDKNLTLDTIILLAKSYEKIGQYEKSIGIYLYALSIYKKRVQKQNLLYLLGKVYLRVGFLERARDIFIRSLRISPRHENSLKYLVITYELLKEYKKAKEAIDALDELGVDVKKEKVYIDAMCIKQEEMSDDKKEKKLYELSSLKSTQRIYFEFILKKKRDLDFEKIKDFNFRNLFDFFWRLPAKGFDKKFVKDVGFLQDILSARGLIDEDRDCEIFELDLLSHLKKIDYEKAELSFEYFCDKCKNSYPFYFSRCPNCHSIDSVEIVPVLSKKSFLSGEMMIG